MKKRLLTRNREKMDLYKKAINKCCMPQCIWGFDLEVHHIHPLGKGGKDEFNNYIVLCSVCHRRSKLHKGIYIKRIDLFVYKFFIEQDIFGLGIMSEDYSDEEFQKLLRKHLFRLNIQVRNKEEEAKDEI